MSICKYCFNPLIWKDRKPFNFCNDQPHTFKECAGFRAMNNREKLDKAKVKRDKRKAMELGNATDEVSKFKNRGKINRNYFGYVNARAIEQANLLRPSVEKYNIQLVIQGLDIFAVAPDDTIVHVFRILAGIPDIAECAKYNLTQFLELVEMPEIRIAKSICFPRKWALWCGDEERAEYSSKAIAEASLADMRESNRLLRELLGLRQKQPVIHP